MLKISKISDDTKNKEDKWFNNFAEKIFNPVKKVIAKKEKEFVLDESTKDRITKLSWDEASKIQLISKDNYIGWNMYQDKKSILGAKDSVWVLEVDEATGNKFLAKQMDVVGNIMRKVQRNQAQEKTASLNKEALETNQFAKNIYDAFVKAGQTITDTIQNAIQRWVNEHGDTLEQIRQLVNDIKNVFGENNADPEPVVQLINGSTLSSEIYAEKKEADFNVIQYINSLDVNDEIKKQLENYMNSDEFQEDDRQATMSMGGYSVYETPNEKDERQKKTIKEIIENKIRNIKDDYPDVKKMEAQIKTIKIAEIKNKKFDFGRVINTFEKNGWKNIYSNEDKDIINVNKKIKVNDNEVILSSKITLDDGEINLSYMDNGQNQLSLFDEANKVIKADFEDMKKINGSEIKILAQDENAPKYDNLDEAKKSAEDMKAKTGKEYDTKQSESDPTKFEVVEKTAIKKKADDTYNTLSDKEKEMLEEEGIDELEFETRNLESLEDQFGGDYDGELGGYIMYLDSYGTEYFTPQDNKKDGWVASCTPSAYEDDTIVKFDWQGDISPEAKDEYEKWCNEIHKASKSEDYTAYFELLDKYKENKRNRFASIKKQAFEFSNKEHEIGEKVLYNGKEKIIVCVTRSHDVFDNEEEFNNSKETYGFGDVNYEDNNVWTVCLASEEDFNNKENWIDGKYEGSSVEAFSCEIEDLSKEAQLKKKAHKECELGKQYKENNPNATMLDVEELFDKYNFDTEQRELFMEGFNEANSNDFVNFRLQEASLKKKADDDVPPVIPTDDDNAKTPTTNDKQKAKTPTTNQSTEPYNITVLITGKNKELSDQAVSKLNEYDLSEYGINSGNPNSIVQDERGYVVSYTSNGIAKNKVDELSGILSEIEHELGTVEINIGATQGKEKKEEAKPEAPKEENKEAKLKRANDIQDNSIDDISMAIASLGPYYKKQLEDQQWEYIDLKNEIKKMQIQDSSLSIQKIIEIIINKEENKEASLSSNKLKIDYNLRVKKAEEEEDFNTWFDRFLEEKDLPYESFEIEGKSDLFGEFNLIDTDYVIEYIKSMPEDIKKKIQKKIVQIDFANGNIMDFFKYLAEGIVKQETTANLKKQADEKKESEIEKDIPLEVEKEDEIKKPKDNKINPEKEKGKTELKDILKESAEEILETEIDIEDLANKYYEVIIDKLGDKKSDEKLGEEDYNKIVKEVEALKKDNKLEDELMKVIEEILDSEVKKEDKGKEKSESQEKKNVAPERQNESGIEPKVRRVVDMPVTEEKKF